MTTRRKGARRVEENIANGGVPTQCKQDPTQGNEDPPKDQAPQSDQVPTIPPAMMNGEINPTFICFSQALTAQSQAIDTQVAAMATQEK